MRHTKHILFLPFRITIRRNHIWISELEGMVLVSMLLLTLTTLGTISILNDLNIRKNNRAITQIKLEKTVIENLVRELNQKQTIAIALKSFKPLSKKQQILWPLVDLVYHNSRTFGYDPLLVLAVIHVESMFDPKAKGQYRNGQISGAYGLMQLKPETAQDVARALGISFSGESDLYKPEINIALGVAYLTQQIASFKSLKLGILAYNQGPGTIIDDLKNNRPLSINYYNKVLKSFYKLKAISDRTSG